MVRPDKPRRHCERSGALVARLARKRDGEAMYQIDLKQLLEQRLRVSLTQTAGVDEADIPDRSMRSSSAPVRAAESDDVRRQDRCEFSSFAVRRSWADLCRSRAMLGRRVSGASCLPRPSQGDSRSRGPWITRSLSARANAPVRGRKRHADPLQGPAQTQGLGLRDRQTINDAQGASRSGPPPRDHHARNAAGRNGVRIGLSPRKTRQEADTSSQEERRLREGADDGADIVAWANRWPTAIST